MKMTISVGRCLKRKTMLVWVKEYIHKKNLQLAKVFVTCKNYIQLSPKCKYQVLKVLYLETQMFWLTQKWLSLFVFAALIKMLYCQSIQWTGTWLTKTWSRRSFATLRATNAPCITCPGTATLQEFLDQKLNKHEDHEKSNCCHWDTMDQAILTTITDTYKKHKETLIVAINDLTRHFYITKLNITSSWYRMKFKATTGVRNTASYIPWFHTTWDKMVASHMINCVLVLITTTITQVFCIKFKQCLFIILNLITHI